jgi:hypothetical protein
MGISPKIMFGKEIVATINDQVVFEENLKDWMKEMLPENEIQFILWVEDRVVPKDRVDIDQILERMGIDQYNAFEIARKTRACLMEDDFWIKFKDDDKWQDNVRRAGYKPTPRKLIFQ